MSADPAVKLFLCELPRIQLQPSTNSTNNADNAPAPAEAAAAAAAAAPFAYRGRAFGRVWVQVRVCAQ